MDLAGNPLLLTSLPRSAILRNNGVHTKGSTTSQPIVGYRSDWLGGRCRWSAGWSASRLGDRMISVLGLSRGNFAWFKGWTLAWTQVSRGARSRDHFSRTLTRKLCFFVLLPNFHMLRDCLHTVLTGKIYKHMFFGTLR